MHRHAEWALAVRQRDGQCVRCGATKYLHAHHIKPKADFPELRYELSNGMTLCEPCHMAEHKVNPVHSKTTGKHRRTLELQIDVLTREVATLRAEVRRLSGVVGECERGVCESGHKLSAHESFGRWAQ